MQRICHALTTRFPNLKIIGLCHEVKSMDRQLPTLLETPLENIEFEAGGLNHFSILLKVNYICVIYYGNIKMSRGELSN